MSKIGVAWPRARGTYADFAVKESCKMWREILARVKGTRGSYVQLPKFQQTVSILYDDS